MESVHSDAQRAVITRVTEGHWRAVADDREVGRGDASRRSDGRIFVSVDAWDGAVFDRLAEAMLAELPRPLHTVVDGFDHVDMVADDSVDIGGCVVESDTVRVDARLDKQLEQIFGKLTSQPGV